MAGTAPQSRSQDLTIRAPARGWLIPLKATPDPAFASGALGDGVAIELLGDTVAAPCAGRVVAIASSRHAVTIETASGAQILIHCGIDTVTLGGAPFTVLVGEDQPVSAGDPLLRVDHLSVVAAGKSLCTPIVLVEPAGHTIEHGPAGPRLIEQGSPLFTLRPGKDERPLDEASTAPRIARTVTLPLPHGLHARPSAAIAAEAGRWDVSVTIRCGDRASDARSTTGLMKLGATHGAQLVLEAGGANAEAALAALADLIAAGAGDDISHTPARSLAPQQQAPAFKRTTSQPEGDLDNCLGGVAAAPGQALGPAYYLARARLEITEKSQGSAIELARLEDALARLRAELSTEADGLSAGIGAAHRAILDDAVLLDNVRHRIAGGESAATAWQHIMSQEATELRALEDPRLAERADDFADLEQQLLRILTGSGSELTAPKGAIVIANDLYPSDLAPLAKAGIAGIATMAGGPTSHLAILAASAGIPMAVAFGRPLCTVGEGETVHLDGDDGRLRFRLGEQERREIEQRIDSRATAYAAALAQAHEDTYLASGERIEIFANLGSVSDADEAVSLGAEGSGLLRTEFLFLDRPAPPGIEEQAEIYRQIMDRFGERPVIIRTLDIGADKPAPYLPLGAEENPALGVRGIRVYERFPDLLETQLRAIMQAAGERTAHVMAPMVTSIDEVQALRRIVDHLREELDHKAPVKLGAMIETPSAALTAQCFAKQLDFLSVGTNDLTQYTLAMDRTNPELAPHLDPMHPAVMRLVGIVGEASQQSHCLVGVCGGAAGDAVAAPVLVGLGATELSVSAARIPELKRQLRELTFEQCRSAASAALACGTAQEARSAVRAVLAEAERA